MLSIAVVPGDGIGPEVTEEALRTLDELGLGIDFDILDEVNAGRYLRSGVALADEDLDRVRKAGSVLFGAVGDPRVRSADYARGVLLRLRFDLDLYVNHRPASLLHDRLSPLRDPARRPIDCVVVRENTEGLYSGAGGALHQGTCHEVAMDEEVSTYRGVSRILGYAFSVARREVCMVDKSNAVPHGGRLWQRCWHEAIARHPDIGARHLYVDAAAMKLAEDPTGFDVIVTNNSYGDILSDLTAVLAGGLGTAASANINPETGYGLYEPVHGSAPDIAGQDMANPVGAILSAALLIGHRGYPAEARAIRAAAAAAIAACRCTPDLGGSLGTKDAAAAVRAGLG